MVVNRYEAEVVGDQPLIAVTLGEEGAVLLEHGKEVTRAKPPHVEAVDGTAAGDAFTACLVVSLLEGREPRRRSAARARPVPSPLHASVRNRHCRPLTR